MCGRYYVDDNTKDEIQDMVRTVLDRAASAGRNPAGTEKTGSLYAELDSINITHKDICPTDPAPVIGSNLSGAFIRQVRWGIQGLQKGQLIINARSETALEKTTFRDGLLHSRVIIPAAGFYEWNMAKEKSTFTHKDRRCMFLAGFSVGSGQNERFTILTTAANPSVSPVHDRMPLILDQEDIEGWLFDAEQTGSLLAKTPAMLCRRSEYEQMSLF